MNSQGSVPECRTRMNQELFDPQATFSPALNQRSIRLAALAAARKAKRPMHASMPGSSASERHPPTFDRHPSDTHSATTAHTSSEASFNPAWAFPPASQKLTQTVGHNASPRMGSMRASGGPRASRRSRSASPVPWKGAEPSDSKDCTFAPAVNVATDAYLQKAGIPATFEERQAFYEQRRHVRSHSMFMHLFGQFVADSFPWNPSSPVLFVCIVFTLSK